MKRIIYLFCLTLTAILQVNAQFPLPTEGLLGFWPFNGYVIDESGNGSNGNVYGATLVSDRFGNANSAYYFNGTDNSIMVDYQFGNRYESEFTLSMWVKADTAQQMYAKLISFPQHYDTWEEFWHYLALNFYNLPGGDPIFEIAYFNGSGWIGKITTPEVHSEIWQFLVFTFNNGNIKLYVNNEFESSGILSETQLYSPDYGFSIGSHSTNPAVDGEFFKGTIDDIRIYNRELSKYEISSLYGEGSLEETISNFGQFKFLPLPMDGFRFLRFESYYSQDDGQVNVYEIQAFANGTNLALNKPGYASSYEGGKNYATNGRYAVDNDDEVSRWSSDRNALGPAYYYPHFIVVDLLQMEVIDSVMLNIKGPDAWNQSFSMLASPDSIDWYLIGSGEDTTGIFTYLTDIESMVTVYDTIPVFDTVPVYTIIPVYDTTTITVVDSISVADTLIIEASLTGIDPPDNLNILKIYPNPTRDYLIINTGDTEKMNGYRVKIVNQLGVTVFETLIDQPVYEVNLSTWTGKGIYYLQLMDKQNSTIEIRKIILQ